ncbi:putative Ricin B lectin protein [Trachipleistophora hominis]|uniref:Putative Ricin B lectin protein n=1 Tax=Trachipleistophora hominis TaxID=72359 RepID=L7JS51_TRAHO|nr:putative Ricin B lectin protein [Trachipleistophora hominis]
MLIRILILLNVPFVVSKLFKIKHLTSDLYIGKSGRYPKWLTLARANSFIEKPSKEKGKVIMKVTDLRNKVWNIEKNKKRLIYFPEHGRSNQIFEIQRSKHGWIKITNNDKCLTYIKNKKRFELRKCDDGKMTQVFLMADEEGKVMSDEDIDEM